jgi:asparaginyl-tRNA synthetase
MAHVYIEHIGDHVGKTVTVKGWLTNRRSSGRIHFLVVRDGTGFLQVVMGRNDVGEATFTRADHLSQESAVIVTGTVRADARAKGGYELVASAMEVVSERAWR